MAKAEINDTLDAIVVDIEYREKPLMQEIPGSRWDRRLNVWTLPLTFASCIRMRTSFKQGLEIGPILNKWAHESFQYLTTIEQKKIIPSEEYGYQKSGTNFLYSTGSGILADEMGLGKSKQVIDSLDSFPVLVVCPNSMKYTWENEFKKWYPTPLIIKIIHGTASQKAKQLEEKADVYIINYESIRSFSHLAAFGSMALTDREKVKGSLNKVWSTVIADEAHRVKDPKAKQTRALWAIGRTAERRIALTGTPIVNSPEDLWSIMQFVAPEEWPSKTKFIDRYCSAMWNGFGGLEVLGLNQTYREEFFKILEPRFLRRTKAEVLTQLPSKTYQVRYVEMPTKQAKAYKQMEEQMVAWLEDDSPLVATSPLVQTTRLVQLAQGLLDANNNFSMPSAKIDALLEIISEAPDEPLVVFTHNVGLAKLAVQELEKAHITSALITGEVEPEWRAHLVEGFQEGKYQVIVLTVDTGGEGITLTRASRCIFLQRPWSMVKYTQAQDRIHRIGQTAPVQIIDVVTKDTIEERILEVLDSKDETMQEVCRDKTWLHKALVRETHATKRRN